MEFVSLDTWTLIFTWVNLFILFLVLKKILFKPVLNILEQRDKEVAEMYEKAETAQKSAEAKEAEYTEKLAEAKNEASRIVSEAAKTATLRGEDIVNEAQSKASAIITKAEKEIEREKAAAVDEVKSDITSIAVSIAEKVIAKDLNEKDYERLVEEFLSGSGEVK